MHSIQLASSMVISAFIITAACSKTSHGNSFPKPSVTKANSRAVNCGELNSPSGRNFRYCSLKASPNSTSKNVVYYFHGLGSSADELTNSFWQQAVEALNLSLGSASPDFVSIDFGPSAILGSSESLMNTISAQEVVSAVIPKLDRILGYTQNTTRSVAGMSMGGFNALNAAAARNFSSIILLCPALIDFNPFNTNEIIEYKSRNAAVIDASTVDSALSLAQNTFRDENGWAGSNPFEQLKNGKIRAAHIFISIGKQDQFGFFEGATSFQHDAIIAGISVDWHPVSGTHCSFDTSAMLSFLNSKMK